MGTDNAVFLEVLEWFDDTGQELVHRIPEKGSGDIKYGAQLTVRESQAAAFFYQGRAIEAFGPGRHTLVTRNIPVLTRLVSLPWGFTSPLRAEVYFVNLKVFTNRKWGTRDPVAFKDSELGLIRLRTFGVFNMQVVQPLLFVNRMVGTQGIFTTAEIDDYLNRVIISRFNDYMGESLDSILSLPAKYDELSVGLARRLQDDFGQFGLALTNIYINSITPPPEVQQAIDDRSRLGVFDDMNRLLQMKAAMAMEKAAQSTGGAGDGVGLGMGLMMPAMFLPQLAAGAARPAGPTGTEPGHGDPSGSGGPQRPVGPVCPGCQHPVSADARYCAACGQQLLIFDVCAHCHEKLPPNARFCSACGRPAQEKPRPRACPKCQAENLPDSVYCNQCGEKID
jgi:membrane protease subunit (stomatin/prohibitin family)